MNELSFDWPQSAISLLALAKRDSAGTGELVKAILAGSCNVDSWLIEHYVLPALQKKGIKMLSLTLDTSDQENRSAAIVPLPDGSAFACNTTGLWLALDEHEAKREIQYIGFRFAPSDRWLDGFDAAVRLPNDKAGTPLKPSEVAEMWEAVTGSRPVGFEVGVLDRLQAFGFGVVDKAFTTQGRLGL